MSTRRGDGWACDHGAQYFTASSPLFSETVAAWQSAGVCEKWGGLIKVFNGSGWDNLKHSTDRFVGTPKMKSPVEYMLNNSGFTVHTTALVEELKRTESGKWDLRLSRDGGKNSNWEANGAEENMFDIVVVAAPSPQAHVLVKFHSLVLAETASAAVMKGCWAVMVRPSLRLQLPFDGAFINGGPLSWISRDSSKPGRHPDKDTWLLHGTMKWSEEHIEDLPADIAAQLVAEFSQVDCASTIEDLLLFIYCSFKPTDHWCIDELRKCGMVNSSMALRNYTP